MQDDQIRALFVELVKTMNGGTFDRAVAGSAMKALHWIRRNPERSLLLLEESGAPELEWGVRPPSRSNYQRCAGKDEAYELAAQMSEKAGKRVRVYRRPKTRTFTWVLDGEVQP